MDTIFAQASAQGRAGVCVIRMSGPRALSVASEIAGDLPGSHEVGLRVLRTQDGEVLDQALVLPFEAPRSFTGEDVVEFHLHGSVAVGGAMLRYLASFDGLRIAEAGEFTRRALENDKLDLTQIEGLADLIDAETEVQRKQALRVFSGHIGSLIEQWRKDLIRAAALIEATIDFADEDVPVDVMPEVLELLEGVEASIQKEVEGSKTAERIRSGFEVAIVGAPNVGKSTLLNTLAGRDAAITSEVAGTTRDVIEVRMDLAGLPVTLLDTAGVRDTDDVVEQLGVGRGISRARAADLRVFLLMKDDKPPMSPMDDDIILFSKADLEINVVDGISGKTGLGVQRLVSTLTERLSERCATVGVTTHERHRMAMIAALDRLRGARALIGEQHDNSELAAEEIRSAVFQLEVVVGRIDVENLLDEIFSSFCIGK